MPGLRGVYAIASTPFADDGSVDLESLEHHLEATIAAGVDGVTILGVAGEASRLSDSERDLVADAAFACVGERVSVVVGVSHDGTQVAIDRAQAAKERGAAAVMIAPPTFGRQGHSLVKHFTAIGERGQIRIVLQDFPPANGVTMEPGFIAELCNAVPQIQTVKLEEPPTALRIRQTLLQLEGERTILGGMSGLYFFDELRSGASGIMTGFPYPELLVEIWQRFQRGDVDGAADVYYRYLPLNLLDNQPRVGIATRKMVLKRRGQLKSGHVRAPAAELDPVGREFLDALIERLDLDRLPSALPDRSAAVGSEGSSK